MTDRDSVNKLHDAIRTAHALAKRLADEATSKGVDAGIRDILADVASDLSLTLGDLAELGDTDYDEGSFVRSAR